MYVTLPRLSSELTARVRTKRNTLKHPYDRLADVPDMLEATMNADVGRVQLSGSTGEVASVGHSGEEILVPELIPALVLFGAASLCGEAIGQSLPFLLLLGQFHTRPVSRYKTSRQCQKLLPRQT
jgi:hypothetical protein